MSHKMIITGWIDSEYSLKSQVQNSDCTLLDALTIVADIVAMLAAGYLERVVLPDDQTVDDLIDKMADDVRHGAKALVVKRMGSLCPVDSL